MKEKVRQAGGFGVFCATDCVKLGAMGNVKKIGICDLEKE
jgi:hypothetical protein